MDSLKISRGKPLYGKVNISGAKNAALPIIAASILGRGEIILDNVPQITDIRVMLELVAGLGVRVSYLGPRRVKLQVPKELDHAPSRRLCKQLRASNLLLGALLARKRLADVPLPGGCNIGMRPMDLHIKGLEALGPSIEVTHESIKARGLLRGTEVYLDFPSVGATENIMIAATQAQGQTTIVNAAREPEIVDLANFLNALGASVRGAGTGNIKIKGSDTLGGANYTIIPDRIEAGTFMIAASLTGGELLLEPVIPTHLHPLIAKLREVGAEVMETDNGLRVKGCDVLRPVNIKTLPYPGFSTDLQSPMLVLLTQAKGTSVVVETVYENRLQLAKELQKMGASIKVEAQSAIVKGVKKLKGCQVRATDLRGGAALVLAGLIAEGETIVEGMDYIERGYENFIGKLNDVGAQVERFEEVSGSCNV